MEDRAGLAPSRVTAYGQLKRNRPLMFIWTGEAISTFGDAFFNLSVMWIVYEQTRSVVETAVVQIVWHLSDIVFAPLAGVLADRTDRRGIMLITNLLAATLVGGIAAMMFLLGQLWPIAAFAAIFVLNSLTTFMRPARASIMPDVVGLELLATASGLFSSISRAASLLGSAGAGVIIGLAGAAWALVIDAFSFVVVTACIALARLPVGRTGIAPSARKSIAPSVVSDLVEGWRIITVQPAIRSMVWLNVLVNVPSFLGPMYPALVDRRLQGGAMTYGAIEAAAVVGGMLGGVLGGLLERRLGAGQVLVAGWTLAGLSNAGIGLSTSLAITLVLEALMVGGLAAGGVSMAALTMALIPREFRGRVFGISAAIGVIAIPFSTVVAAGLADHLGVELLFVVGGAWIVVAAALAHRDPHVRLARIGAEATP